MGDTLVVEETTTNLAGTTQPVASTPTPVVSAAAPVNTVAPGIPGNAEQGQTLTEIPGSWTNQPTGYLYQWERCTSGTVCSDIDQATGQTYKPTTADVGDTIEVQETAKNQAGPGTPATSAATTTVTGPGPMNTTAPKISGTPTEGETLSENQGAWSGRPTSYNYQWERCDRSGANCHPIEGAIGQGYAVTAADVGDTIVVLETASNANGPGQPAPSDPTAVVAQATLTADAGESINATEGVPVTFDASASTPVSVITSYGWDFGDGKTGGGVGVQHTYTATGQYTATLSVSDGTNTATSTVTVTVSAPAPGAAITVQDSKGNPIQGADVVYMASDGSRISATSDSNGVATLDGLPDGSDGIYAYASGYQVATGSVTVSGGVGSATLNLSQGQVATASLTSTPMTLAQIEAAGIDPNAPGNQTVIHFSVQLAFPPGYGQAPSLCGYINAAGEFLGNTGSCGGGPGGGCGGSTTCTAYS
ncbi:MAG: PKD domain-containing protein [Acidimicrobiales bacterium]